ncbi:MAG: SRPBCC family protein [Thermoplasmata archaeon]
MARSSDRFPGPQYHIATVIRAPLPYVYAWCTDFDAQDAQRERDDYARKIVGRTPRRVVFEDLTDSDSGWSWRRHTVTLRPPNRWHSDSLGSHRDAALDYELTALSPERTRLDLRWRRRPTVLGRRLSKREAEGPATQGWRHLGRALEQEYRRTGARSRR